MELVSGYAGPWGVHLKEQRWVIPAIDGVFARCYFSQQQLTTWIGVRSLLGLAESGNFPSAVKSVAEWFPRKEQALAVGILTSGTSIGAVAAPAIVPRLAAAYGWQAAFLITGLTGFIWLGLWYVMYYAPQKHRRVTPSELKYIEDDRSANEGAGKVVDWLSLLRSRKTWAFIVGKVLTDPIWWFMLFWLPSYFSTRYHLDLKNLGLPLVVVYFSTSIGSIFGGWLSSQLITRAWTVQRARQSVMLGLAFLVVPIAFSPWIDNMWAMVGLLSLAAAAHQGWSANLFTTASDMFPRALVGSVVGIGGMAGAVGGTVFPLFVGALLDRFVALGRINSGYNILFIVCGSAYLVAWGAMFLIRSSKRQLDGALGQSLGL
jgi:ACS family hexuronate transporter-like MFS transporter